MENKDFDQFIKKSLENLEGDAHLPMDWSLMENKLEADGFDHLVKDSMENLEGKNFVPMDWSLMEDKLEADGFDHLVKDSMENLEGNHFIPMDWSLMEDKLGLDPDVQNQTDTGLDQQVDDIYLDAVAYDHLKNLEAPYNEEHWKIMSARLDEEYAYRRKVFITKMMEAVVVLLLVWTAINYFPIEKIVPSTDYATIKDNSKSVNTNDLPETSAPQQLIADGADFSISSTAPSADFTESIPTTSDSKQVEENGNTNTTPTTVSTNTDGTSTQVPPTVFENVSATPALQQISSTLLQEDKTENTTEEDEKIWDEKNAIHTKKMLTLSDESIFNEIMLVDFSYLPSLQPTLLNMEELEENYSISKFFKKKKLRTHEIFFSMYASGDLNFVQSEFFNNSIGEKDLYQRDRYGYGGGFSLGFQLKRVLVETGASYNFVSYAQREESNIIGSVSRGFVKEKWEDAELNMVQIPLNIQYGFLMKNNWRLYTLTGVSLNMALQNNFSFQLEEKQPATASRSISAEDSPIANEAIAYKGILEGGNMRKNSYLTANLGFGLERKFTYRWSLFVQPIYRHYFLFDGIGPNKDHIHSGSVNFGAKVKIR